MDLKYEHRFSVIVITIDTNISTDLYKTKIKANNDQQVSSLDETASQEILDFGKFLGILENHRS